MSRTHPLRKEIEWIENSGGNVHISFFLQLQLEWKSKREALFNPSQDSGDEYKPCVHRPTS